MKIVYLALLVLCLAQKQMFLQADSDETFETGAELDPMLFINLEETNIALEMPNQLSTPDNDPFLLTLLSGANEIFYDDVLEEVDETVEDLS